MQLFSSNQWKAFPEIKTGLVTKYASGTRARTVIFISALINYFLQKMKILLHARKLIKTSQVFETCEV